MATMSGCNHKEVSLATSSDWESVCAECGEILEGVAMTQVQAEITSMFAFVSGENAIIRHAVTVLEAWRKVMESAKTEPMWAWLQTDKLEAWDQNGNFIKVQNWAEWCEELAAADRDDASCECEVCNGDGYVVHVNKITTDAGTKWVRTAVEGNYKETCDACNGSGRIFNESQLFNGPG